LLAISGGPDSMALALSFLQWWYDCGWGEYPCHAAVVDHRLRGESTREAEDVAERLRELGFATQILTVQSPRPKAGIQAWARAQRYHLLAKAALELSPKAMIITAHHRGDQAETVAMRLLHRSGLRGLAGIREETAHSGMRVIRPLLDVDPMDLHRLIADAGVMAVDDPSNRDHRFERVRVRHMLTTPKLPEEYDLCRLAAAAGTIHDHLMVAIAKQIKGHAGVMPHGWGWVGRCVLSALPPAARNLVLDGMIRALGPHSLPTREAALIRLAKTLLNGGDATLGGCEWRQDEANQRILCYREAERPVEPLPLDPGQRGLFDGRWHVEAPAEGEFQALGARRCAELRAKSPQSLHQRGIPARVFWSMPVFVPHQAVKEGQWLTLEDGSITTHLWDKCYNAGNMPIMRFAGLAQWPWHESRQERPKP
jgi:tRNA(Ile)-lysidine synthase